MYVVHSKGSSSDIAQSSVMAWASQRAHQSVMKAVATIWLQGPEEAPCALGTKAPTATHALQQYSRRAPHPTPQRGLRPTSTEGESCINHQQWQGVDATGADAASVSRGQEYGLPRKIALCPPPPPRTDRGQ